MPSRGTCRCHPRRAREQRAETVRIISSNSLVDAILPRTNKPGHCHLSIQSLKQQRQKRKHIKRETLRSAILFPDSKTGQEHIELFDYSTITSATCDTPKSYIHRQAFSAVIETGQELLPSCLSTLPSAKSIERI